MVLLRPVHTAGDADHPATITEALIGKVNLIPVYNNISSYVSRGFIPLLLKYTQV